MSDLILLAPILVAAGSLSGFLAGVFGVGGGTVVVPVLYEVFVMLGVPDELRMPLCAGTSLALIIPTAARDGAPLAPGRRPKAAEQRTQRAHASKIVRPLPISLLYTARPCQQRRKQ
jgi:hypothetical protein